MAETVGGRWTLDITDLKNGITEANRLIRISESEFKAAAAGMGDWTKNADGLSAKAKSLNTIIDIQEQKVNALKHQYAEVVKEKGKNSAEAQNLEVKINKETESLNKNKLELNNVSDSLNNVSKNTNQVGKEALKTGDIIKANLISEAIISGVKALGSALKGIASAAFDIGKQAVESYAEFEQLVGGVETLFKDNATLIQNYADNAYKTAGLSANQYMETVTSFSASLLQSLNGDTAEAAKVADMAITDMADNANKMGSSMQSIQSAYQGFAKQNYTMLDNLKLGYGGTKSEMERLLKDATALTGIKYDINSLNDVYKAINVIQNELGITGTTAKEASETISGSISAMKSSYTNFISGIANDNADLSILAKNLIDSILTVAKNIMPVIERVVRSMIEIVPKLLDMIVEYLPDFMQTGVELIISLAEGALNAFPQIIDVVVELVNKFTGKIIELLPSLVKSGVDILLSLVNGITQTLPELLPVALETVFTIVDELINNIDMIIDTGIEFILALVNGIVDALPKLIDKAPEIIGKLADGLVRNLPRLVQAGMDLLNAVLRGILDSLPKLYNAYHEIPKKLKDAFFDIDWVELGKNIIQGIGKGIMNLGSWLTEQAKNVGNDLLKGVKDFFGIRSPSKKMQDEVGVQLAKGLGAGFSNEMKSINKEIQNAIPTSFNTNIGVGFNSGTGAISTGSNLNFTQNIYSPKPLTAYEVYRQTKNASQQLALGVIK